MNKEVKEIKEYIESPFSARGGISYEQMQLIFDYINQLETNIEEAINIIKNHIGCEKTLGGILLFPTKRIIDALERGKE